VTEEEDGFGIREQFSVKRPLGNRPPRPSARAFVDQTRLSVACLHVPCQKCGDGVSSVLAVSPLTS